MLIYNYVTYILTRMIIINKKGIHLQIKQGTDDMFFPTFLYLSLFCNVDSIII